MSAPGNPSHEHFAHQQAHGPEGVIVADDMRPSSPAPHHENFSPPYLPGAIKERHSSSSESFDPVERMANMTNDPTGFYAASCARLAGDSAGKKNSASPNTGHRTAPIIDGVILIQNRTPQTYDGLPYQESCQQPSKAAGNSSGKQVHRVGAAVETRRLAPQRALPLPQDLRSPDYRAPPQDQDYARRSNARRPVEADEDYSDREVLQQRTSRRHGRKLYEDDVEVSEDDQEFVSDIGGRNHQSMGEDRAEYRNGGLYEGEGDEEGQQDDDLFVQDSGNQRQDEYRRRQLNPNSQNKRYFDHDDLHLKCAQSAAKAAANKKPRVSGPRMEFRNIGENLANSRYSGAEIPWGVNQDPVLVPSANVSDAALLKRGIPRGKAEKICKRGYGANDPENIAIVNMHDGDMMLFPEIVDVLNAKRTEAGRDPSLTVCGATGRYNRTAPLLYTAEGKEFIPLSKRRKGDPATRPLIGKPKWTAEMDKTLVLCAQEVVAEKWNRVAELFAARTGMPMDPQSAARRHTML